ncbi:unnamed protein product, partial [Allacma fusca]
MSDKMERMFAEFVRMRNRVEENDTSGETGQNEV